MALSSTIINEIKRKAQKGIKLTHPTPEKEAIYNQYRSSTSNGSSSSRSSGSTGNIGETIGSVIGGVLGSKYSGLGTHIGAVIDTAIKQATSINRGYTPPQTRTDKTVPVPDMSESPGGIQYQRPDYSPMIKDKFSSLRESLLAKLRANKAQALSQYEGVEKYTQQAGRDALNQNDVERAKALQQLRAAMEASGQYGGGENISGTVGINTQAQQNAGLINRDISNQLAEIQKAISLINTTAADKEAELLSQLSAEEADALMRAQQAADQMDFQNRQFEYNIDKDTLDRLERQTQFEQGQKNWEKQFETEQLWKDWERKFAEENVAWQRNPDNPVVQAQVLANKAAYLANQLSELELDSYPEEQKLRLQELRKRIAQIGAAPTMTQYDIDIKKAELDKIKAEIGRINADTSLTNASNPSYNSTGNGASYESVIDSMKKSGKSNYDIERYIMSIPNLSLDYAKKLYSYAGIPFNQ